MKKMTNKQRERELRSLVALSDRGIDTSDVPELTAAQLRRAERGVLYRPVKKPVTIRLDVDVLLWLKQGGPGYQTKANALLRKEMMRAHEPQGGRRARGKKK